jgi:uncharacterized protein
MKGMHSISFVLVIVGALNWGLIGIGRLMGGVDYDVVKLILNPVSPALESVVYLLVGLSAVNLIVTHKKDCRHCNSAVM